jgi:proteasome accessory factor B
LRFAARLVSERTWHESQRVRAARHGSAILELKLGALEEIQRWILSWGSHVRVLEPRQLADRVRDEGTAIAALYKS